MMTAMTQTYQAQLEVINEILASDIGEVKVNEGGDDFLIFEAGSDWIFRFSRNDVTQEALQREVTFLSRLKDISPLAVPEYRYVGDNFGGYPKIQGVPFTSDLFQDFSTTTRERIGRQLAMFLSAIHSFPVDEAFEIGVTNGWNGLHQGAGEYFLEHVAPLLSPTAHKRSVTCMEQLLSEEFAGKVIHGDFYLPDHVFYNERTAELGVIDFADVTIYDPAHDYQCIVEIGGKGFFELVMKYYQGQEDLGLLRRSEMRLAARPLFVAGYIFVNGLTEQYAARLARIESMFG
jgi:aminoglycoside 2''-phosphotransferase